MANSGDLQSSPAPVPVINIAPLLNPEHYSLDEVQSTSSDLMGSMMTYGAVGLRDHGISLDLLQKVDEISGYIFDQPLEEKMRFEKSSPPPSSSSVEYIPPSYVPPYLLSPGEPFPSEEYRRSIEELERYRELFKVGSGCDTNYEDFPENDDLRGHRRYTNDLHTSLKKFCKQFYEILLDHSSREEARQGTRSQNQNEPTTIMVLAQCLGIPFGWKEWWLSPGRPRIAPHMDDTCLTVVWENVFDYVIPSLHYFGNGAWAPAVPNRSIIYVHAGGWWEDSLRGDWQPALHQVVTPNMTLDDFLEHVYDRTDYYAEALGDSDAEQSTYRLEHVANSCRRSLVYGYTPRDDLS